MQVKQALNAYKRALLDLDSAILKVAILTVRQQEGTNWPVLSKDAYNAVRDLEDAWYDKGTAQAAVNKAKKHLETLLLEEFMNAQPVLISNTININ